MTARSAKSGGDGAARPIRNRRDYKAAAAVVKTIAPQAEKESAAEKRLKSLIHEMEKFDGGDDDELAGDDSAGGYEGPRRRWSDDGSDLD